MKLFRCKIILIAPNWPRQHWFPQLLEMLVACPISPPVLDDLLSQGRGKIVHPNPRSLNLTAWLLSTKSSAQRAFQRTLENSCLPLGDQELRDYNCKFRRFSRWYSEQKIDPYTATLKDCTHFRTHLFSSGPKYKTITGYRSMLSLVSAPIGRTPVGQHPVIIRLLRGVFNKRPPLKNDS